MPQYFYKTIRIYLRKYSREVEHLGEKKGQVSDNHNDDWFHDTCVSGEAGDDSSHQATHAADANGPENDDEHGTDSADYVDGDDVLQADGTEALEHSIQHLCSNHLPCRLFKLST